MKMDLQNLKQDITALWHLFFDGPIPRYVLTVTVVITAILGILFLAARVVKEIGPLFHDAEERRRVRRRKRFAEHVSAEIDRIDNAADWSEHKFAELEAEVEAEGRRRHDWFGFRRESTLRRERSLSRALRASRERLILLEGEPGAGKSVALLHLAVVVASSAAKSGSANSVVPLYINLKSINRPFGKPVDAELIREHVLKTINRANIRDVEEFLHDEFARGLEEGTWLFLFDSFDEIPDILSATTADTSIREYADAIDDFLRGFNACRGIVASRYFRGPGALGWPRFRILALSDQYRRRLIRRAELPVAIERDLIGWLELTGPELAITSRNPMFLGLLCQHVEKGNPFPENTHVVFEEYVNTRLRRDEDKLIRRFSVGATQVREAAEQAAFCMAYHPELGLSPTRDALAEAMAERGYVGSAMTMFDALEFIKLARVEGGTADASFTFAHRRFQEYFATSVVLDAPDIVTPEKLLTDARWRETAVVLLQTQCGEQLDRIVATIGELLEREVALIERAMPEDVLATPIEDQQLLDRRQQRFVREFPWPPLALHLLSLLQSGYQGRASVAPKRLRGLVGRIVYFATSAGTLTDRKWALEVAGISPSPILTRAIREAFKGGSRWLGEVAYRQVSLLTVVPPDIASSILSVLLTSFASGRLQRERDATYAHLRRLPQNAQFVDAARLLMRIPSIDFVLHGFLLALMVRDADSLMFAGGMAIALTISAIAPYVARFVLPGEAADLPLVVIETLGLRLVLLLLFARAWPPVMVIPILLWPVFALVAAGIGQFTRIVWWPVLSALPLLFAVRSIGEDWRKELFRKPKVGEVLALGILVVVIMLDRGGQLGEITNSDFVKFLSGEAAKFFGHLGNFPGYVLVTLSFGFVGSFIGRGMLGEIYDSRLWKREVKRVHHFTTAEQMIVILRRLRTTSRRVQLVERAVNESMLEPSLANELSIRCVAIEFENEPAEDQKQWLAQRTPRERLRFRFDRFKENRPSFDMRIIDGLNMLAEQLRARRAA